MKKRRKKQERLIVGRNTFVNTLLTLVVGLVLSVQANAQCAAENSAFLPGEELTFNLYYNWKFVWVKAGTADLSIGEVNYKGQPAYEMNLLSDTNKRVDMFFRMRDTITSVFTHHIEPLYYRKGAAEGKRYTVDQAWFEYKNGETIVDQQRWYKSGEIVKTTSTDKKCVYDMLSALAVARSFDTSNMKEGQTIEIPMVTGKRVANQVLVYNGVKNTKADDGHTYRCLVFTFSEFSSKSGKNEPVLRFYITDDRNHLPIRLDMYLNIGSAKAYMKTVSGQRYPITALID